MMRSCHSQFGRAAVSVAGTMLLLAVVAPLAAGAQGNLSTQGYGFPPGQLSARANGTAGAVGETDPFSALNPAGHVGFGSKMLSFNIQPEYRRVTDASGAISSSIARYPLAFGSLPIGEHWAASLTASTLLDRTWATTTQDRELLGTDSVLVTSVQSVDGAMNDLRLAIGWSNRRWLRVGVGIHGITGRNVVLLGRTFPPETNLASFTQERSLSIGGAAASAGVDLIASKVATLSVSYRYGARIHVESVDTVFSYADVPDRFGAGLSFTGIRGTTIAARISHDGWSSLESLGSVTSKPVDAWDSSVGAEVEGPRFGGAPIAFRVGVRSRTLPFQAGSNDVKERSGSVGTGLALANGRVFLDLAAVRAMRDAGLSVKERAWTFSIGISARP